MTNNNPWIVTRLEELYKRAWRSASTNAANIASHRKTPVDFSYGLPFDLANAFLGAHTTFATSAGQ
jgi:hypothetical protein